MSAPRPLLAAPAIAAIALLAALSPAALADGGTVILRRDAGPFSVTLFAPGLPLRAGETDLSVLVQARASGEVLFDPTVVLSLAADAASAPSATVRLTHGLATNRLLQAANVDFPHAGKWLVTLDVSRGSDRATLTTELSVEPNRSRATLVWFYLLLPMVVILLFAANQVLKRPRKTP
jgi:hypothetical protein